jgi:hypothetical protein
VTVCEPGAITEPSLVVDDPELEFQSCFHEYGRGGRSDPDYVP